MGKGQRELAPRAALARAQPALSRALSHLQSEAGVLWPVAVPGGRSAARCRQEALTADYREDLEPAGGRRA